MDLAEIGAIDTSLLLAILACVLAVWALLVSFQRNGGADAGRLSRLERHIDDIQEHFRQEADDHPAGTGDNPDSPRLSRLERRVHDLVEQQGRIEGRLHDVLEALGREPTSLLTDSTPAAAEAGGDPVHEALRRGSKIEAIRLYRDRMGVGLKEAKDAVEAIERDQLRR